MTFETYLKQAWNDHGTQASAVASSFADGIKLIESEAQIPQMAGLIAHVMGEHLGHWQEGLGLLKSLSASPFFKVGSEAEKNIERLSLSLQLSSGQNPSLDHLSLVDQGRIFAATATALGGQNQTERARLYFMKALQMADTKEATLIRSLAVTGNQLACALEEKKARSPEDVELMILAAQTARKYWELAGSWSQVQLAEYRLAMTYIQAQDLNKAKYHAQNCLTICEENKATAIDMFFAHEALALSGVLSSVKKAKMIFAELSTEDKVWCEKSMAGLPKEN